MVFGVSPLDAVAFLVAPLVAMIGGVAALVPGRRVTQVMPAISLRAW